MGKLNRWFVLIAVVVLIANCKKPYNPPGTSSATSYLVVEGVIDPGGDTTVIRLSKTVKLSEGVSSIPVLGATVMVGSDGGASYSLIETGKGYYRALLNLNIANKYQLKIAAEGNNYASDFTQVKNAPGIDTLGYSVQSGGVQIKLNTHDATNNSRYYRWSFTETYLLHSAFDSYQVLSQTPKDTILFRPLAEQIYQCWPTDTSTTIILGSSAKLAQDVITSQPITLVASTSEKLADLYSILVQQYALSADAYNYYQQLAKNTQQLGSIFDAQPSELPGNVHCINNPGLVVIGYVTAGSHTQKRIFVDSRNLPNWQVNNSYAGCILDSAYFKFFAKGSTISVNQVAQYLYNGAYNIPVAPIQPTGAPSPVGYSYSDAACVDCTLRGTNIKPSFWP